MKNYIYATADIHGRHDLLMLMLDAQKRHAAFHQVSNPQRVFLGDYVDRGPDSRAVIETLMKLENTKCLKGNHEDLMVNATPYDMEQTGGWKMSDAREVAYRIDIWMMNGGLQTLESYGSTCDEINANYSDAYYKIPQEHLDWMKRLPTHFETEHHFFVHAGVSPHRSLADQHEHSLLWIREQFLSYEGEYEKYIVHGHTPRNDYDIRHNRCNLDTGAFHTGVLTCAVIDADKPGKPIDIIQVQSR